MPLADHFGPHYLEITYSRPMDYATRLTAKGFRVYEYRPRLKKTDKDYEQRRRAYLNDRFSHVIITWYAPELGRRAWIEGHGFGVDGALAAAYGRFTFYAEA